MNCLLSRQILSLLIASLIFFLCIKVMLIASYSPVYHLLIEKSGNQALSTTERLQLSKHLTKGLMQRESVQFQLADGSMLFHEKEVIHMKDVAQLLWGIRWIMLLSALFLLISFLRGKPLTREKSRLILRWSLILLASIASMLLLFFPFFFHLFHLLSFRNDFWLLDPKTDYLIQLFPQEFFLWSLGWIFALSAVLSFLFWGLLPWFFLRNKE